MSTTPAVSGYMIGDSILDFGYPAISWIGMSGGDQSSVINFNHTAPNVNAGNSVVYYDGTGNYSDLLTLKVGSNFINVLTGATERWGDYSGSQIKYDETGIVWVAAGFGRADRTSGTWVSELFHPTIAGKQETTAGIQDSKVFPQPATDRFSIEFELASSRVMEISLFDFSGKLIKCFHKDLVKKGSNRFTFNTDALGQGIYFLKLSDGKEINLSEKIVIVK